MNSQAITAYAPLTPAPPILLTPNELAFARDWVANCEWIEDSESIEELSDVQIARGINRHYDGGLEGMKQDAAYIG